MDRGVLLFHRCISPKMNPVATATMIAMTSPDRLRAIASFFPNTDMRGNSVHTYWMLTVLQQLEDTKPVGSASA